MSSPSLDVSHLARSLFIFHFSGDACSFNFCAVSPPAPRSPSSLFFFSSFISLQLFLPPLQPLPLCTPPPSPSGVETHFNDTPTPGPVSPSPCQSAHAALLPFLPPPLPFFFPPTHILNTLRSGRRRRRRKKQEAAAALFIQVLLFLQGEEKKEK